MTDAPNSCRVCDLIRGSSDISACYEDAESVAFMETQPVNTGHVVVVPRTHYNSLLDVPPETGDRLFQVSRRLAGAIRRVTQCDDIDVVISGGLADGEDTPHYHLHIIPRRAGDGFRIDLPFGRSRIPDRTALDATALQLTAAMRDSTTSRDAEDEKTLEIPASVLEREVVVKVAREGVTSGDPSQLGAWRLEEGAHGELIYDVRDLP